ncbi:MAG: domain/SEC-C motif domain protein [Betaproteobacteria bacterium]|nr:domain/SEC-C motif domain protein [Betaproteobacteria bacterium]
MLLRLLSGLFRRQPPPEQLSAARAAAHSDHLAESLSRGAVLSEDGKLTAAVQVYMQSAKAHPREPAPQIRAGNILRKLWRVEEAVEAHTTAFDLSPDSNPLILSAVLFQSHYLAEVSPQALFDMHCRYGRLIADELPADSKPLYNVDRNPERRLRVGYVSPNLSRHSVGYFIEPVIASHDRAAFEICCYHTNREVDDTTSRIEACADRSRNVHGMSDDALARLIAGDRIDVLVDLAGHTSLGRLPVFARRPAPVQLTWLGYPDTTGLTAIDYRITDAIADPAPAADSRHTERLLRIPGLFLCYQPPFDAPAVMLRDTATEDVVFCSFNALEKVNERVIALWSSVLRELPRSRLLIKAEMLKHPDARRRVCKAFAAHGIDEARLEFEIWAADCAAHLSLYGRADIALDTFPYNGTTTTCEALWMGVPVVTLAGEAHMSRVGATLLGAAGLDDLVAQTPEAYVEAAVTLARDPARRCELRGSLRPRLEASPLLDHAGFTRKLEGAMRGVWREWCETPVR